ncbi:MAG: SDR family oxidoreductase [Armatimonadetes bacterium]|nr:SDR family oxidoreductase [Armatimonadota bacterium]
MRALITGHNGYIGSVMVPVMKKAGHEVVGLDTYFYEDCTLGPDGSCEAIPTIRKDIRDVTAEDLKGLDAVIHLAALSNDPLGDFDTGWTYDINQHASVSLARAAKEAGVPRYLYSSSCSMYGASGDSILTEEADLKPLTAYAISKVKAEKDIAELADDSFSPVYMRNATAYGVSPRLRADIVLNNLVCWAYTTGKVKIMSDGTPWRPIVHIEDISNAFAGVLAAPREITHNEAINIGADNQNYQVKDLAEIVRETVPGCEIEYAGQGGPDPRNYRVDFSKLTRLIPAFESKWDAKLGAKELYEAVKSVDLKPEDFQGRKYIRLNQLKHLLDSGRLVGDLRWDATVSV